jgi:hypothetical protein
LTSLWAAVDLADNVIGFGAMCAMHAAWRLDPDFKMPAGYRVVRVRAKAWVRRAKGAACVECLLREGGAVRLRLEEGLGLAEIEQEGGEA